MASTLNSLSLFSLWDRCSEYLSDELSAQQFNTWIKPLAVAQGDCEASRAPSQTLVLLAPNRFIRDWVCDKFQLRLDEFARLFSDGLISAVKLEVAAQPAPGFLAGAAQANEDQGVSLSSGTSFDNRARTSAVAFRQDGDGFDRGSSVLDNQQLRNQSRKEQGRPSENRSLNDNIDFDSPKVSFESNDQGYLRQSSERPPANDWSAKELAGHGFGGPVTNDAAFEVVRESSHQNNILGRYRFDNFVEGKSNQLARAAAIQVVENPSGSYNPLFLYGGVGLGKTHLMHAVGNEIKRRNPSAKVVYLHSEQFVGDMVKALQLNAINDFKRYYRSVDALLIDDIQFFANKERSQEEFFHTFNALLEGGHQMIFSCDRYPKSISGVEERLKSRFGWGLTVQIEPPELETRVAILNRKAEQENIQIPNDAAFFMAQKVRANVRELEGALKRVNANAEFLKAPITIDLIKESLKDLLALQDKMVSIDNIQRTVAEYYKIKIADLHSKRRNRSVARPRQVAMALAKELTNHSLPEIGDAFGGRDHTTVLHACRKIKELRESTADLGEDYHNLIRLLST